MKLEDLTKQWLEANGYEGLYNENGECACKLDDLMPCEQPDASCKAGHIKWCNHCDLTDERHFHIVEGKRTDKALAAQAEGDG